MITKLMFKPLLIITLNLVLLPLSACRSTTASDTLSQYIKAIQINDTASQKKLKCSDSEFSSSLEGIEDWKIISFQHPDDKGGGVFYIQSGSRTWEVGVRNPDVLYENTLEAVNLTNALLVDSQKTIEDSRQILGGESPEPLQPLELPMREDYSRLPYCIVNVS